MQLIIENIGLIKQANITLDGLTVIAGNNDTGKSTVGKLLFSIVKSISRYKEDLEEDKEKNIHRLVERIYFFLRRRVNFQENIELKHLFFPPVFISDIAKEHLIAVENRINLIRDEDIEGNVLTLLENLKKLIKQDDNKNETIKRAFKKILYSEFRGEIKNKYVEQESIILIKELENEILNIKIDNSNNIDFELNDDLYFNDSTLIETPMILNFSDSIEKSKSYFEIKDKSDRLRTLGTPDIAFHIKDIDSKLKESTYNDDLFESADFFEELYTVINGEMRYLAKEREFVYFSKDGQKHKSINTASGIKSFGILQMLFNSGFIDERSIIIIDEPEVHLHPKWQLKYAELIILLVKNGMNILVTTHSPYMIEALELYTKIHNASSNFYLAKKMDNGTDIIHLDSDLEEIYKALSEPFSKLEEISLEDGFEW